MSIINFFFPKRCLGTHRKHDWEYFTKRTHVGTGRFLEGKEITRIESDHHRKCKRPGCSAHQVFGELFGWGPD